MDLNATLIGQLITFAVFIAFTVRYIWPPTVKAMEQRKQRIADSLAAAERGKQELELAEHKAAEMVRDAKHQADHIIEEANKRAIHVVEESKRRAHEESERIMDLNRVEIDKETQKARQDLKYQIAFTALNSAESILQHNIDKAANSELLDKLITEI